MSHLTGESLKIIMIILMGWSCFSFADVVLKYIAQSYNPSLIAVVGCSVSVIILSALIFFKHGWAGFKWHNPLLCFMRMTVSGFISFSIVTALSKIPLTDMYSITFSSPFIGVIMAYLILKEHVGWHRWLCVVIGFLGVLIVVGPQFENLNNGLLFALCAAFLMGVNNTIIRKIGRQENTLNLSLLAFVGMVLVNGFFAWDDLHLVTPQNTILFSINGLLVLTAILLTTYGISHAKSVASIAPFLYVQAIWGVIFGYFLFDDTPTITTILGLMIVVAAGLYMIYRENQLKRMNSEV
jgi:drug/metabolite transporter (DMT)-like permease